MAIFEQAGEYLHVNVEGFKGTLGAGLTHKAASAETTEAMTKLLAEFEANAAKFDDATKAAVKKALPEIKKLGGNAAKVAAVAGGLDFSLAGKTATEISAAVVENPLLKKFVTSEALEKAGVKVVELDGLLKSKESLAALLKATGDQTKAIEAEFIKHHGLDNSVLQKLMADEPKFVTAAANVARSVGEDLTKLGELNTTYATAKKTLADAMAAGGKSAEELKPLQTAAKEAGEAITKLVGNEVPHGSATLRVFEKTNKTAFDALKADKVIGKQIEAASKAGSTILNAASKTEWGWTKKAAPTVEGFMGKVWHNRGVLGKGTVLAGIGAVTYAIAAATGIIGGKTAEVERSRQQGQGHAAGLGA